MSTKEIAVMPLRPIEGEFTTEKILRMILNQDAVLISRSEEPARRAPEDVVAHTAGAFAKGVSQAASQFSKSLSTDGLFQVMLPAGSTIKDLVPAVGGGFRSMVRSSGKSGFSGHAAFVPVLSPISGIALGPLIATVGFAMVGDMLSAHEMNKKLDSIQRAVTLIDNRMQSDDRAIIRTALRESDKVRGYLLDQASIPVMSPASSAFGDLNRLANRYIEQLERWNETVSKYSKESHVYGPDLMAELTGNKEQSISSFECLVYQTYETLALRARTVILEKVAAEAENDRRSLPHVEAALHDELSEIALRQQQLVDIVDALNIMQIDSIKIPVRVAGKSSLNMHTSFARLAKALHEAPTALPVLDSFDHAVLDVDLSGNNLTVLEPSNEDVSDSDAQ